MKEIDHVLADKRLLGAGLGPLATWQTWLIALKAAFGRPLTDEEREVFHTIAGKRDLPKHRVRELWCVAGRRSGKSRMAAAPFKERQRWAGYCRWMAQRFEGLATADKPRKPPGS